VGKLAYRIALPLNLVRMHDVFHVFMLRKYITNPDVVVEYEPFEIQEGLTYLEELVKIVDKKQVLRTKIIPIIKVLWHNIELRKHCGMQSMTCGVAIRICLNDCVRLFLLRLYLNNIPIFILDRGIVD
jgi:hypothetical protein